MARGAVQIAEINTGRYVLAIAALTPLVYRILDVLDATIEAAHYQSDHRQQRTKYLPK